MWKCFFPLTYLQSESIKKDFQSDWYVGGGGVISNFELSLFQSYTKLYSSVIKFCPKSLITQTDIKNYRREMQDVSGAV